MTSQVVAVKKSRNVSLPVKRTTFQHEACVLRILRGRKAIPLVYNVGYTGSHQLHGNARSHITRQVVGIRKKIAPQVAVQMGHAPSYIVYKHNP